MKCTLLYALFIVLFIGILPVKAQRNNIWCFGDSSGINFNNGGVPSPISIAFRTRGTCVSISDLLGNLLFMQIHVRDNREIKPD